MGTPLEAYNSIDLNRAIIDSATWPILRTVFLHVGPPLEPRGPDRSKLYSWRCRDVQGLWGYIGMMQKRNWKLLFWVQGFPKLGVHAECPPRAVIAMPCLRRPTKKRSQKLGRFSRKPRPWPGAGDVGVIWGICGGSIGIGYILGMCWDNGKANGDNYSGIRARGMFVKTSPVESLVGISTMFSGILSIPTV